MANTLFLRLEAPMQSWGERGRWSVRDTSPEPTKSGVIGLLSCALGWRDDERIRNLSLALSIGVRHDRLGDVTQLVDYHTVGGGYLTPQLLTAEGKPKANNKRPHNEQTWRTYLCDTSFLVALQTRNDDPTLIATLSTAVQQPVWPIYLGRKSCVPTLPVFAGTGTYESLQSALESVVFTTNRATEQDMVTLRAVMECDPRQPGSVMRRDHLVSRRYWRHEPRYSMEVLLHVRVATTASEVEAS